MRFKMRPETGRVIAAGAIREETDFAQVLAGELPPEDGVVVLAGAAGVAAGVVAGAAVSVLAEAALSLDSAGAPVGVPPRKSVTYQPDPFN